MHRVRMPVIMLAGIECSSEPAENRSASPYFGRWALFGPGADSRVCRNQTFGMLRFRKTCPLSQTLEAFRTRG